MLTSNSLENVKGRVPLEYLDTDGDILNCIVYNQDGSMWDGSSVAGQDWYLWLNLVCTVIEISFNQTRRIA